jgi:hypothetical protein
MTPGTFMSPNRSFLPFDPFRLFQNTPMRFLEDPFTAFRPFPSDGRNHAVYRMEAFVRHL